MQMLEVSFSALRLRLPIHATIAVCERVRAEAWPRSSEERSVVELAQDAYHRLRVHTDRATELGLCGMFGAYFCLFCCL